MFKSNKNNTYIFVLCVCVCLLAVACIIKCNFKTGKEKDSRFLNVSSLDGNKYSGELSDNNLESESSELIEENDEIFSERIDLNSLPYYVYFRKISFELKDCVYSKNLCGQPKMHHVLYDDIEFGKNGEILNGYSYLHITFTMKNEDDKEIVTSLNTSRIYVDNISNGYTEDIVEMCGMNRPPQEKDFNSFFHWTFLPDCEEEFTVTFILPDRFLMDNYRFTYAYNPLGRGDTLEINGKMSFISDAKLLHINNVIRTECKEKKTIAEQSSLEDNSSMESSQQTDVLKPIGIKPSNEDEISFWEKGKEKAIIHEYKNEENGEIVSQIEFIEPVYIRNYGQLKDFCKLYDLSKDVPIFEFSSPFDGTEAKYIIIDECIHYCFDIPGYKEDLMISWGWSDKNTGNYSNEYIENEYKAFSSISEIQENVQLISGDILIICIHNTRNFSDGDYYVLAWTNQGAYIYIDHIPETIPEKNPELFNTLIERIQTGTIIKSYEYING